MKVERISFIHTADIHLGSVLNIAGEQRPPAVERAVAEATLEGFRRVCSAALQTQVDFVLIAGDLYDLEARSVRAQDFFLQECRRLAQENIDVFLIAGNHDPLRENRDLWEIPPNVQVFGGRQPQVYQVLDREQRPLARIVGQSYQSRAEREKIHLNYDILKPDLWNIALLHTQLAGGDSNYVPASLGELKERVDLHYWALGHLHQQRILNETFPLIAYPGIPQGRHFGEEGRGGCLLVELGGFKPHTLSFIPLAPVVYQ